MIKFEPINVIIINIVIIIPIEMLTTPISQNFSVVEGNITILLFAVWAMEIFLVMFRNFKIPNVPNNHVMHMKEHGMCVCSKCSNMRGKF